MDERSVAALVEALRPPQKSVTFVLYPGPYDAQPFLLLEV